MLDNHEFLNSCRGPWVLKLQDSSSLGQLKNIIFLDGMKMISIEGVYHEVAMAFKFPDYFGKNFNALFDMLTDLSWFSEDNYIVIIKNAEQMLSDAAGTEALEGFLEILSEVGKEWSIPIEEGEEWDRPCIPFHTILELNRDNVLNIPCLQDV